MKSIEVEVNLRIPRMKVPSLDERGYPIDNSLIRFTKRITVPAIPKPGEMLHLTKSDGSTFECEVTRADWHDDRALFILGCKYAEAIDLARGVHGPAQRRRVAGEAAAVTRPFQGRRGLSPAYCPLVIAKPVMMASTLCVNRIP